MTERGEMLVMVAAVGEAISQLSPVPSGHLYARVMDKMDLGMYSSIIELLIRADLVKRSSHLLTWIGPPVKTRES